MNRRSLLLGGVVASVAGILGVKARPVEVAATPTSTEIRTPWVDGRDTAVKVNTGWVDFEVAKDALYNTPEYKALLVKRVMENLGVDVSGYGVMQEMYAQAWEQVDPLSIYPDWRGAKLVKVIEINHDDTDT